MNKVLILIGCIFATASSFAQGYKPAKASLMTIWGEKIDPNNVHQEYPRPQLVRENWLNLNGLWQFEEAKLGDAIPSNEKLSGTILVPFPWESALSAVRKQLASQRAWYKRNFTIPKDWTGKDVILNFEAVDWQATVYVNGKTVGVHKGAYDAFSFDITSYLKSGNNELIVGVYDPGSDEAITTGKQQNSKFTDPSRYFYSPSSGIWQTVWMEAVSKTYIKDFKMVSDIDKENMTFTAFPSKLTNSNVEVIVLDGDQIVATTEGKTQMPLVLNIPNAKLWSPDSPFLYDIKVRLKNDKGEVVDRISSYFGMRKISLKPYKNLQRMALNNEFLFQYGPLDQGYWPDGIYTAPSDEALKWDLENTKAWGFNMTRKHIKIESKRWFYWCDKLGLLVWQDMPSTMKARNEEEKILFETELQQMVKQHWNSPSIVNWVVFNEHWGLYDVERLTKNVMELDPSRLVTGNSGIDAGKPDVDYEVGHIKDNHHYRPPTIPLGSSTRAIANGEFGAIGYKAEGHVWDKDGPWVHDNYAGKETATKEYETFLGQLKSYVSEGLSSAVYTEWTDVENEMNGFYTYDRKVQKLDKDRVVKANLRLYEKDWMKEKYPEALPKKLVVDTPGGF